MLRRNTLSLTVLLALAACNPADSTSGQAEPQAREPMTSTTKNDQPVAREVDGRNEPGAVLLAAGPDPHSYSRPDQVRVTHVGFNWVVDFDAKALTGDAILLLDRKDPSAPLLLDGRDLDLEHVYVGKLDASPGEHGVPELATDEIRSASSWAAATFTVGEPNSSFGAPITIELPAEVNAVKLSYATRPAATGLQWLEPAQTAGKNAPFLYSQSQAIHARSWIPAQDSPGVRTTWDAIVEVDERFTAVMAADQLGELPRDPAKPANTRAFRFVMPQPVPAYLIALAVGELERREIGPRTAVWADPTVVEVAAHEFADMETMLESAEALYGAYAWGRYDVLVLPPAFPFGGMENPRLTFATPTLLAGDRSLVAVIAHELAHSWSGNLVTNKTWGDLWLNEGFTVYFERRIIEQIYGPERATIEAVIGKRELLEELRDPELLGTKPEFQRLSQDLRNIDPDESFSSVPYEKGALLLGALEQAYGRARFDEFLRAWFEAHAFGTVATSDFIDFVGMQLISKHPVVEGGKTPDLAEWVDGAGLPDDAPEPHAEVLDTVEADAKAFAAGEKPAMQLSTKGWTPWHWLHFLRSLPAELTAAQMAELDAGFSLTESGNAEIVGEWLELAARCRYEPAYPRLESFLIEVGRRKFLTPIYRALASSEDGREQATKIYAKARPGYHAISRGTIDGILRAQ